MPLLVNGHVVIFDGGALRTQMVGCSTVTGTERDARGS